MSISQESPWPIPVPIHTDRWTAKIAMLMLFAMSFFICLAVIQRLGKLEPQKIPAYAALLSEEGRHLWLIADRKSGDCLGVIAGGWKEGKNIELVKFSALTGGGGKAQIRATVSEYKLLNDVSIVLTDGSSRREISYDGQSWKGISNPTTEPIMFVETSSGARKLKLPNRWARGADHAIADANVEFREASEEQFFSCRRSLNSMEAPKREILQGVL